jgi:hypothetical protein
VIICLPGSDCSPKEVIQRETWFKLPDRQECIDHKRSVRYGLPIPLHADRIETVSESEKRIVHASKLSWAMPTLCSSDNKMITPESGGGNQLIQGSYAEVVPLRFRLWQSTDRAQISRRRIDAVHTFSL